jgi:NTP pyrophosphatase (non-canonical NTP hydrolase)
MEETGELLAALGKFDRNRVGEADVITELADVSIMVEQMAVVFGLDDFKREKERKLTRLKERLDKKESLKV